MTHTLEECPNISSEYQDTCQECGELSSCVCLCLHSSRVGDRRLRREEGSMWAYRYQFRQYKSDLVGQFGYAESYREAMDNIAHAVRCKEVGK
jgi:hypothetical protein